MTNKSNPLEVLRVSTYEAQAMWSNMTPHELLKELKKTREQLIKLDWAQTWLSEELNNIYVYEEFGQADEDALIEVTYDAEYYAECDDAVYAGDGGARYEAWLKDQSKVEMEPYAAAIEAGLEEGETE